VRLVSAMPLVRVMRMCLLKAILRFAAMKSVEDCEIRSPERPREKGVV